MMQSVSFIIPVYNCKDYLESCVASLMDAVGQKDEILLIDDGSNDGSGALCDNLAQKYPQIKVLHQRNSGASAARNRGMDLAKNDFLMFVDADDSVESARLAQLLRTLRDGDTYDMVTFGLSFDYYYHGKCYRRDALFAPEDRVMQTEEWGKELHNLFSANLISPLWNKVFRRAVIEENHLRLNEALFLYEDLEFVLRFMGCCGTICNCPDVIYRYRQSEDEGNAKRRLKRVTSITELVYYFENPFNSMIEQKHFGEQTYLDTQQILLELYLMLFREKAAVTKWSELPALSAELAAWAQQIPNEVIDRLPPGSRQYLDDAVNGRRAKLVLRERKTRIRHRIAVRVKNTQFYQKHCRGSHGH